MARPPEAGRGRRSGRRWSGRAGARRAAACQRSGAAAGPGLAENSGDCTEIDSHWRGCGGALHGWDGTVPWLRLQNHGVQPAVLEPAAVLRNHFMRPAQLRSPCMQANPGGMAGGPGHGRRERSAGLAGTGARLAGCLAQAPAPEGIGAPGPPPQPPMPKECWARSWPGHATAAARCRRSQACGHRPARWPAQRSSPAAIAAGHAPSGGHPAAQAGRAAVAWTAMAAAPKRRRTAAHTTMRHGDRPVHRRLTPWAAAPSAPCLWSRVPGSTRTSGSAGRG